MTANRPSTSGGGTPPKDGGGPLATAAALLQSGDPAGAERALAAVLERHPANAAALHLMGLALDALGRRDEALNYLHKALALAPAVADFHGNLSAVLGRAGRHAEAEAAAREAVRLRPGLAAGHHNLGSALLALGKPREAIDCQRRAVALRPGYAEAHHGLGAALLRARHTAEAEAALREAIGLRADLADAHVDLATALERQARSAEAAGCLRLAVALRPDNVHLHSGLLFVLNHVDLVDERCRREAGIATGGADGLFEEHLAWARRHAEPLYPNGGGAIVQWSAGATGNDESGASRRSASGVSGASAREPNGEGVEGKEVQAGSPHHNGASRTLRIGYLSPDFREHSVARFVEPLLAHHDRAAVEVFAYSNTTKPDATTDRLRGYALSWRDVAGRSDDDVASLIRADAIDVLVDLAGHTGGHRLLVLARRAAPVQATYLGYPNTTGVATIDWRITDAVCDPPGMTDAHHTERLYRLERCNWCYRPSDDAPPVVPDPPAVRNGHVTFGCLNRLAKVTPAAARLWARILNAVPHAKLLLPVDGTARTRHAVRERFAALGLPPERLAVMPRTAGHGQYLERVSREVDLALDTFPYNGTTTTCDALWMGVPTVGLAGRSHASRVTASLLGAARLEELVAETEDGYVARAVELASDPPRLAALRAGLREQMRTSPLCDGPRLARAMEDAYRHMWRERRTGR